MLKRLLLCLSSILLILNGCTQQPESDMLEKLDKTLSDKSIYKNAFREKASVLKEVLSEQVDDIQRYGISLRLADMYRGNSKDTSLLYLQNARDIAKRLGNSNAVAEVDFRMAKLLIKAGYAVESNDILEGYRGRELPKELLHSYYDAEHSYWVETSEIFSKDEFYSLKLEKREYYRNLLLECTSEGSWEWHNLKREQAVAEGNVAAAREHALAMVQASPHNSKEYAEATYWYAHSFEGEDEAAMEEWLIRSAMVDIICCTKDYASLSEVAHLIFLKGDIDRAFTYLSYHCMPDALYFNGKLRPWQVSQFFPEIVRAYQANLYRHNRHNIIFLICVSLLSILLLLLIMFLVKRQRMLHEVRKELQKSYSEIDKRNRELVSINERLTELNAEMKEADKVKQEYITLFLGILSENIDTTRRYKNHVLKTIRQGNAKALADEIEMLPPIDEDITEFYKMFDQTFVNLYPDFVEKFNGLLVDGAEIVPKGDDILTPELRIFALIKLVINDSSRIASLLHYSANTIYNYRAKIKNKARGSRDDFENAVRDID